MGVDLGSAVVVEGVGRQVVVDAAGGLGRWRGVPVPTVTRLLLLGLLKFVVLHLERGETELLGLRAEARVALGARLVVQLHALRLVRRVVLLIVSKDRSVAAWRKRRGYLGWWLSW